MNSGHPDKNIGGNVEEERLLHTVCGKILGEGCTCFPVEYIDPHKRIEELEKEVKRLKGLFDIEVIYPIDDWAENNAKQLKKDISTHIEMTDNPERYIIMSIRDWLIDLLSKEE